MNFQEVGERRTLCSGVRTARQVIRPHSPAGINRRHRPWCLEQILTWGRDFLAGVERVHHGCGPNGLPAELAAEETECDRVGLSRSRIYRVQAQRSFPKLSYFHVWLGLQLKTV